MKPARFCLLPALILAVVLGCQSTPKKTAPRLDRKLLGEELQFGRKAAEFELWHEAIFRWEKVQAEEPGNSKAVNNLAIAYESIGDFEKAKALYQEAIELDEDSPEIRTNYKRFLSFYKRHQRQLERERKRREGQLTGDEADEEEESEGEPSESNREGGNL